MIDEYNIFQKYLIFEIFPSFLFRQASNCRFYSIVNFFCCFIRKKYMNCAGDMKNLVLFWTKVYFYQIMNFYCSYIGFQNRQIFPFLLKTKIILDRSEVFIKITMSNSNSLCKKIGNNKIANLKKLIQSAASQAVIIHPVQYPDPPKAFQQQSSYFPKHLKSTPFLIRKEERTLGNDKQNHQKMGNRFGRIKSETSEEKQNKSLKRTMESIYQRDKKMKKSHSNGDISFKNVKLLRRIRNFSQRSRTSVKKMTIDNFKMGKKLGRGRFGNVYMAEDKQTHFLLAIKIINKKQLKQSQMEDQLLSELKIQTFINHPNILKMYGFFDDTNNIYILLELGQQCLYKQLRKKVSFSEKTSAYYTKQVLESLKYLHSELIIHRDLKPENIILVNNVVKLGDFGWSVYSPVYKRQTFCGTLDYVPPQIVEGEFYDEKVDIWSLGVLIYELVIGKAPFQDSGSESATFQKILEGQVKLPTDISNSLKEIIEGILVKNPGDRLTLEEIDDSNWLQLFGSEGRSISSQIWQFWQTQQ